MVPDYWLTRTFSYVTTFSAGRSRPATRPRASTSPSWGEASPGWAPPTPCAPATPPCALPCSREPRRWGASSAPSTLRASASTPGPTASWSGATRSPPCVSKSGSTPTWCRRAVAPSHAPDRDVSVGSLVRRRLGDATADRIVQPLLGGIHCADIDAMSARMCAPQLLAALATGRGLVRGARATKTAGPPPRFLTLRGGMSRLVDGLVAAMPDVRLRTDDAVVDVLPHRHGWEVVGRRTSVHARALIVCAPPRDAAALLDHVRDTVAHNLGRIESTSVGIVLLTYGRNSFDEVPQSSGFIVSPQERTLLTACTWVSAKWPHLRTGEHVIARCSTCRSGDARAAARDDAELIDRVDGELRRMAGIRGARVAGAARG